MNTLPHRCTTPFKPRCIAMLLTGFAWAASVPAGAQTAPADQADPPRAEPQTAKPDSANKIETVTVTGQRVQPLVREKASAGVLGERSLLDTPFSIQSYSRALIEAQQARTVADVLKNDASARNLQSAGGFASQISIRGFDTFSSTWDGLLGPAYYYQDFPLEIVDAVEVFKGPAALLFGGGNLFSPAGSINYRPKRAPQGDARIGNANFGVQTGGATSAHVDLGGRAGADNAFGWRVNLYGREGGLALDNVELRERVAAGSFDWRVTPTLTLTADLGHIRSGKDGYTDTYGLAAGVAIPRAPSGTVSSAMPWSKWTADRDFVVAKADWAFDPAWTLSVAATRTDMSFRYVSAGLTTIEDSAGNATLSAVTFFPFELKKTALSARLAGRFDTGSLKHQLTLAAMRDRENYGASELRNFGVFPTNIYRPIYVARPTTSTFVEPYPAYTSDVDTLQVIDAIGIGPRWTAMLGIGRVRIKTSESAFPPAYSSSSTTPLAGLLFKPNANTSLYASFAEGLEPGGTAPAAASNAGEKLPPRATKQFEAGVKADAAGLQWAAALFRIDRALEYIDAASNLYVQSGKQQHTGFELSASGQLLPGLDMIASALYLRPTIDNGDPALRGNQAAGVPERSISLYASYRLPGWEALSISAGTQYKSAQWLDLANTQRINAYTTFDLGAALDLRRLIDVAGTLRLNVDNVADKAYWSSVSYGCCLARGEPRTVKLSASVEF
jgi:iron complex outermembrane recepter protein